MAKTMADDISKTAPALRPEYLTGWFLDMFSDPMINPEGLAPNEILECAAAEVEILREENARLRDAWPQHTHWPPTMKVYDVMGDRVVTLGELRRQARRGQLVPFVPIPEGR